MGKWNRPILDRIAERLVFDPVIGCVVWTGVRNGDGYGNINVAGSMQLVHRIVWSIVHGPIPAGKQVLHKCNRGHLACATDGHLKLGTNADNMRDRAIARRFCQRGHPFIAPNLYTYGGHRVCRECCLINRRKKSHP